MTEASQWSVEQIESAREWLDDNVWGDEVAPGDPDDWTSEQIRAAIDRHYAGGWAQFVKDFS